MLPAGGTYTARQNELKLLKAIPPRLVEILRKTDGSRFGFAFCGTPVFYNRVKSAVGLYNDVQKITVDLMDSSTGDSTDFLGDMLSAGGNLLGAMLKTPGGKAGRSATHAFEKHHIFPEEFSKDF